MRFANRIAVSQLPALDFQPALLGVCRLSEAVVKLSLTEADERGAIFTRPEVVDFILDIVGYTVDQPLHRKRLLEPAFGHGDFLLRGIERLAISYRHSGNSNPVADLSDAIRGVELHRESFDQTHKAIVNLLFQHGIAHCDGMILANKWLSCGDFLLTEMADGFSHIVGNPPYVRQENIPSILIEEYRRRYSTIFDRADLYVPFIERSLRLLAPGGAVSFICADRWMKNRYGGPLRQLIAEKFHFRTYVDMVDTQAFHTDVVAYPAIFVIGNEKGTVTRLARRPVIEAAILSDLANEITSQGSPSRQVQQLSVVTSSDEPWLLDHIDHLAIVRRLESQFPSLEAAGCKVGIGVATGADNAFIGAFDDLDVEPDRKIPLVMTRDIVTGEVQWLGKGVVNPFEETGGLVSLDEYPRLKHYLEVRHEEISRRHVAKKTPGKWYRTIDRIYPALVKKPKLLIPDIKGEAHIVYDEGCYYPHHNLYFITSDTWDLESLQAVLLSGIARLFIAAYCTKMRGGSLRFQAQYLRRIRVPIWEDVSEDLRNRLKQAARSNDLRACSEAVIELYDLNDDELGFLNNSNEAA
jgi:hypothetical protein